VCRPLAALSAAILCAALAPAAPVPKQPAKGPVYYYPTKPGAKWVYDSPGGEQNLVVSKVDDRKGTKVVTTEVVTGKKRELFEVVEVSAAGLVETDCPAGKHSPPLVLLKLPFKAGDSWAYDSPGAGGLAAIKGTRTVVGVEQIKVPAGTFEAVKVNTEYTLNAGARHVVATWYAPNVGLVRIADGDGKSLWLLKSFTPGKD
jgi:hypothetical protein